MKQFITLLGFVLTASGLFGQQLVSILTQHKENGVMANHSTQSYTYDAEGNVEMITTSFVYGEYRRRLFTYDNEGNVITEIHQEQDELTQSWMNQSMYENSYTVDGKIFNTVSSYWNSTWVPSSQTLYNYDASGFMDLVEIKVWDNNAWQDDAKFETTNDAQGNVVESVYSTYNSGIWTEMIRDANTYNAEGLMETLISQNMVGGVWSNATKNVFSYNADDLPVENLSHNWDQDQWKVYQRFTTTYTNQLTDVFTWEYWDEDGQEWLDTMRMIYTYQTVVAGTEENTMLAAEIYPNPAKDVLHVDFAEAGNASITLIDLSGKVVKTMVSSEMHNTISLTGIQSGTYLLTTVSGGNKRTVKITVT